jgi:O-methyltransferase StaMB
MERTDQTASAAPRVAEGAYAKRMENAYTDDYLRIMGIEHYRLGYFEPDIPTDDLPAALERYTEVLLAPLNLGPTSVVLDLGCATGATASWLVRRYGCTVHAIDIVEGMVAGARSRFELEQISDRAIAARMDARSLEFKDATFDAVIGIETVYHFPDKGAFFKSAARVLKPGGQIVLSEYLLKAGGPKIGVALVKMILESDKIEEESDYRAYLAEAGLSPPSITDRHEQTVEGTNRAYMTKRYRSRLTAYAHIYFGLLFSLAYRHVLSLWAYMFRKGHVRHVFLYSRKPAS